MLIGADARVACALHPRRQRRTRSLWTGVSRRAGC